MSSFWFGFMRGLALPIYVLVGIVGGIVEGFDEWQHDTDDLRFIRARTASTGDQDAAP